MSTVIIREYSDIQSTQGGEPSGVVYGVLVTDMRGTTIKTVNTTLGTPVDSTPLDVATRFIEIESTADVRYAIRPRDSDSTIPATARHNFLAAGETVLEAVHGGAVVNFLEV